MEVLDMFNQVCDVEICKKDLNEITVDDITNLELFKLFMTKGSSFALIGVFSLPEKYALREAVSYKLLTLAVLCSLKIKPQLEKEIHNIYRNYILDIKDSDIEFIKEHLNLFTLTGRYDLQIEIFLVLLVEIRKAFTGDFEGFYAEHINSDGLQLKLRKLIKPTPFLRNFTRKYIMQEQDNYSYKCHYELLKVLLLGKTVNFSKEVYSLFNTIGELEAVVEEDIKIEEHKNFLAEYFVEVADIDLVEYLNKHRKVIEKTIPDMYYVHGAMNALDSTDIIPQKGDISFLMPHLLTTQLGFSNINKIVSEYKHFIPEDRLNKLKIFALNIESAVNFNRDKSESFFNIYYKLIMIELCNNIKDLGISIYLDSLIELKVTTISYMQDTDIYDAKLLNISKNFDIEVNRVVNRKLKDLHVDIKKKYEGMLRDKDKEIKTLKKENSELERDKIKDCAVTSLDTDIVNLGKLHITVVCNEKLQLPILEQMCTKVNYIDGISGTKVDNNLIINSDVILYQWKHIQHTAEFYKDLASKYNKHLIYISTLNENLIISEIFKYFYNN